MRGGELVVKAFLELYVLVSLPRLVKSVVTGLLEILAKVNWVSSSGGCR